MSIFDDPRVNRPRVFPTVALGYGAAAMTLYLSFGQMTSSVRAWGGRR